MANLSKLIESTRKEQKVSVLKLAEKMKINPRTYYRKLGSADGFSESEILPAMDALGLKLIVIKSIDYVRISGEPEPQPDAPVLSWKDRLKKDR